MAAPLLSRFAGQDREQVILTTSSETMSRYTDEHLAQVDVVESIDVSQQPVSDLVNQVTDRLDSTL
jgi:predicted DNA-binding protein YlxM (UPF0122 family)